MSIVALISLVLSLVIIARSVQDLFSLRKSILWLNVHPDVRSRKVTRFFVCIPALNEQDTIVKTIKTFLNQSYSGDLISIYIVTTAKELCVAGRATTKEVIEEYLSSQDKSIRGRVHVVHYPEVDGYMAHQINFVADLLREDLGKEGSYFVVYNADSRPNNSTFDMVNTIIANKMKNGGDRPTILQQSAIYQYAGNSWIAEGAGLHQTLWTLTHEIPRLLKQSSRVQRLQDADTVGLVINSRVAHCVGHGLFVRGDYYNEHPLSQDILNEDLPYGLLACALREPIYPIPSLELASTPSKIMGVYLQKAAWFNPFFEFLRYGKDLINKGLCISKLEIWWLLIQAYGSLTIWLLHSGVLVGGLITSIVAGWAYIALWMAAFLMYWIFPALIVTGRRRSLNNGGDNSYISIFGGLPYVLTHSVGPLISVCQWLTAGVRGTKPLKRKTQS